MSNVENTPRLDFSVWTEKKEPELKTLEECLEEAGGFPFVARALSRGNNPDSPYYMAGSEFRAIGRCPNKHIKDGPGIVSDTTSNEEFCCWDSGSKRRWTLVGHKT